MDELKELRAFFSTIEDDHRIGSSHISLYMAIFQLYWLNDYKNPVSISRKRVMRSAKINGIATYHRCMKDLMELGYIEYMPSFDPKTPSKVNLLHFSYG